MHELFCSQVEVMHANARGNLGNEVQDCKRVSSNNVERRSNATTSGPCGDDNSKPHAGNIVQKDQGIENSIPKNQTVGETKR